MGSQGTQQTPEVLREAVNGIGHFVIQADVLLLFRVGAGSEMLKRVYQQTDEEMPEAELGGGEPEEGKA